MRSCIKDFVKLVARSFPINEPIYEFGSFQVPGQEGFADLRPIFPQKQYIGCDIREGPGVDQSLDLHNINLPSESVGTIFCLDTLEHVEYPHLALEEIERVLKPNGLVVISSVMNHHIHDYPFDYWRFTPEGFKSLLKPFPSCFVGFAGDKSFPHTIVGLGFEGKQPNLEKFMILYSGWQENQNDRKRQNSARELARLLIPPILINISRKRGGGKQNQ
jgi:SAM-dependent methyltransferase